MVSEFDLPCAECGDELVKTNIERPGSGDRVAVADCPSCGSRYYPRSALERL